jgi:hypothetical protein
MPGEQDVPITRVFMEGRLIGRARLEIVGPDQLHIQTRGALRIRRARAAGADPGQKRERKGDRARNRGCFMEFPPRWLLCTARYWLGFSETTGGVNDIKR